MEVDWMQLPPELLEPISKKLTIYADYIYMRAVCSTWRKSVPGCPTHLPPQLPWLMLPQSQPHQSRRAFFNLSTNKVHFLNLPQASHRKRFCGSAHGWVVLLDETPTILLLNPLTGVQFHLPPLLAFPNVVSFNYSEIGREYTLSYSGGDRFYLNLRQMRDTFIKKVVLSSSPGKDSNFIAVAIFSRTGGFAYCKNGAQCWTMVEALQSYFSEDVIYIKGLFYAIDKGGEIAMINVNGKSPIVSFVQTPRLQGGDLLYLVYSGGDLLLVTRYLEFNLEPHQLHLMYRTISFEVFRLNYEGSHWEIVTSLGDKVLFVGQNSSLSLSASDFPGCEGDCIYFTDDYSEANYEDVYGEHDLGIYKLWDGSIEPLPCYPRNFHYQLQLPPPIWVTPNPF